MSFKFGFEENNNTITVNDCSLLDRRTIFVFLYKLSRVSRSETAFIA